MEQRTINKMLQDIHDYIIDSMCHDNIMLHSGICMYGYELFGDYVHDYNNLTRYLRVYLPPRKYDVIPTNEYVSGNIYVLNTLTHCWKPWRPYYRLKWLKKHIKLTKTH